MLSVCVCVDQLQPYVYCVYCPVLAMYLMCPCPQTRMMRQLLLCGLVMGVFSAPQHTIVKKSGNIPAVSRSIITTSPLYWSSSTLLYATLCSEAGGRWSPLPHVAPGAAVRAQGDPQPQQEERGQGAGAALCLLQPGRGPALAAAADGARSAHTYCLQWSRWSTP